MRNRHQSVHVLEISSAMCLEVWFIVSPCWKVRHISVLTLCSPLKWNYLFAKKIVSPALNIVELPSNKHFSPVLNFPPIRISLRQFYTTCLNILFVGIRLGWTLKTLNLLGWIPTVRHRFYFPAWPSLENNGKKYKWSCKWLFNVYQIFLFGTER